VIMNDNAPGFLSTRELLIGFGADIRVRSATSLLPDEHSNPTELHPDDR
jgi:hypothetical protein